VLRLVSALAVGALLFCAPAALADDWLPHDSADTWTYSWTDSTYAATPTKEKVTVKSSAGTAFTLAWTTDGLDNSSNAVTTNGTVDFQETNSGIVNTNWSSNPPPPSFPILCASLGSCGNSLSSVYYNVIWGSRVPVLDEPLLKGATWSSTGGAQNDVGSSSEYLGTEQITVPAFPSPVTAAKVRSDITQAGAIGDPYGSGVRTIWWVYGVGPVKIEFDHAGGANAPVTTAVLQSTNLTPKPPPADDDWFPLKKGLTSTYRWTNKKYLPQPEVEKFSVAAVVNSSAQVNVTSVSGPIKVSGAYGFTLRLDGLTNIWGTTKAATLARLPKLGPVALSPSKRRHFFTPYDLMDFGFNPILPAYAASGASWSGSASGRDYEVYGVTGTTRIVGVQNVTVPAGTFKALVVTSTLSQTGFPAGSGTRTEWFAPDRGLVKLVFRHGDGSVSNVELLK
jgi:hypothetical protein